MTDFAPAPYQRWRCLPRLIRTDDLDIAEPDASCETVRADLDRTSRIIERLESALLREGRLRGRGAWQYDGNRHLGLAQALAREEEIYGRQVADYVSASAIEHAA